MFKFILFIIILLNCYGGDSMPEYKRIIQRTTNSNRIESGTAELETNELAIVEDLDELIYKNKDGKIIPITKDYRTINSIEDFNNIKYRIGDIFEVLSINHSDGKYHKRIICDFLSEDGVQLSDGLFANVYHNKFENNLLETKNKIIVNAINELNSKFNYSNFLLPQAFVNSAKDKITGGGVVVNILGDSISYGLDSTDMQQDSWVELLKKSFLHQHKSTNTGFEPFRFQSETEMSYIKSKPNWKVITANKGNYISGVAFENTTVDPFIFRTRVVGEYFRLYFQKSTSGTAKILVNGIEKTTLNNNTSLGGDTFGYVDVLTALTNADSYCEISIVPDSDSSNIRLLGWTQFLSKTDSHINNFSVGGRTFADINENLFKDILSCDILLFALNHNDRGNYESNEDYRNNYNKKFENLLQNAKLNNVKVVVLDFMWNHSESNSLLRKYLKTKCINENIDILSVPNLFKLDGTITTTDEKYNVYKIFKDDLSHPSDRGHEFIFSIVAEKIGLQIKNKNEATLVDPRWYCFSPLSNEISNINEGRTQTSCAYRLTPEGSLWRIAISTTDEFGGISPSKSILVADSTVMLENHKKFISNGFIFNRISGHLKNENNEYASIGLAFTDSIRVKSFNNEFNRKVGSFLYDVNIVRRR